MSLASSSLSEAVVVPVDRQESIAAAVQVALVRQAMTVGEVEPQALTQSSSVMAEPLLLSSVRLQSS